MQEEPAQGGKRKAEGEGRDGEEDKKAIVVEEEPKGEKRAMDEWDAMAESLKERSAKRAREMELNGRRRREHARSDGDTTRRSGDV